MKSVFSFFLLITSLLLFPSLVRAQTATIPERVLLSVGASSSIAEPRQQVYFVAKTQNFQNLKKIDLYVGDQLANSCTDTNVCGFLGGPYDNYPDKNFTYYAVGYEYSGLINETGRKTINIQKEKIPEASLDLFAIAQNAPKIITPGNNEILEVSPRAVRLSWRRIENANGYEVEHAYASGEDVHFANPVYFSVNQNSIYLQDYLYGYGAFRYRVRAIFQNGTFGNWSGYQYYTLHSPYYGKSSESNITITPSTFTPLEGERIKVVAKIKNRKIVNTIKIYFNGELKMHCVNSANCEADIGPFYGNSGRQLKISAEYSSEKESGSAQNEILVGKTIAKSPAITYPEKYGHDFAKNRPSIMWGSVKLALMYQLDVDCLSCKGLEKNDSDADYSTKDTTITLSNVSTQRESYRVRIRAVYPSEDGRSYYSPWSDFVYFVYGDNGEVNPHNVDAPFFQPSLKLVDEERKIAITSDKLVVKENGYITLTAETVDKKPAQKIVISVNKKAEKTCTNSSICVLTLKDFESFSDEYVLYSAHLYTETGFNNWTGYKKFKVAFSSTHAEKSSFGSEQESKPSTLTLPNILRPTNYDTLKNYPRVVYLAWSEVDAASSYEVEVYCKTCNLTEWDWKKKYFSRSVNFSLPALEKDDMYAVRVRGVSADQVDPWSSFSYFYYETKVGGNDDRFVLPRGSEVKKDITPVLDDTPLTISPKSDEVLKGKNLKPQFVWGPVYNAVKYEISVFCKSCTSNFELEYNTWHFSSEEPYFSMPEPLRKNGVYVIQVRAVLKDGAYSPWSKQRFFQYEN